MAKKPPAKKAPRPARAAAPAAAVAPAGDSTTPVADAATDAADSTAIAANTAADGIDAVDTTAEADAIDDAGSDIAAADAVQQLAGDQTAGQVDEATERLAEQGQRPPVVLPAGEAIYRVLSALNHDLRDYPAGSDITLTVDQAAPLLGHTVEPKDAPEADA